MAAVEARLFITVGTDHHPFDRLIDWVDSWIASNGKRDVRCLVQAGSGTPPRHSSWRRYLGNDEMQLAIREASAVVCHGGPGTIMSCRSLGVVPIVVPRRKALGEAVDDHQVRFARKLAERGEALLVERRHELWRMLDRAVEDRAAFRSPVRGPRAELAVTRFEALVNDLMGSRSEHREKGVISVAEADRTERTERSAHGSILAHTGIPEMGAVTQESAMGDAQVFDRTGPWPAVSVVVPTRDRPVLLRRAVEQILQQRYPGPIECIVVFDQSAPELPPLQTSDLRRLRAVVNRRTPGLAGARNAGALVAGGELLGFCDDDDAWLPDKLRLQVDAMATRSSTVATCGLYIHYRGRVIPRRPQTREVTFADLLRSRVMEAHPSTILVRREDFLGSIGPVDESIPGSYAEDYEWLLRAARRHPIVVVPEALVAVSWNGPSYFAGRWETIARALRYLLDRYPEFRTVPRGLARIQGQIAFALAASGRRREALTWAWRSLASSVGEPRAYLALAIAAHLASPERLLRLAHRFGRGI